MAVLPSQARHAPEASATTTTTTTTADHRGRCRAALPCCLFARGPPIVVVVVVVGPSHEKVPWMSDMAREPKGSEERGGSRQTAGRQTGHRHRARAARTRWPAPLTPCHCMQPCQGSVVEVAVDVGRGPVALGDLAPFSCTFLGGRQVRWVESSRWGEFDADRRGVEVPGIRRGRVVWCPGPCRRDLVHGHGCLMLGSERKGVVAPRVSTILPVPESLESRVERREESNGPLSQQAQQQEQSKLLSFIPRYLPTDPGTTHKEVSLSLLLDLGNRLGSNRGLKLKKESATKEKKRPRKAKATKGVFGPNLPRCELAPLLLDRKYL